MPKEWYETINIGNRVLCWVSDGNPDLKDFAEWIIDYDVDEEYPFTTLFGDQYLFATPVVCDDLKNN